MMNRFEAQEIQNRFNRMDVEIENDRLLNVFTQAQTAAKPQANISSERQNSGATSC